MSQSSVDIIFVQKNPYSLEMPLELSMRRTAQLTWV